MYSRAPNSTHTYRQELTNAAIQQAIDWRMASSR